MLKQVTLVVLAIVLAVPSAALARPQSTQSGNKDAVAGKEMQARMFQLTYKNPGNVVKALEPLTSDGQSGKPMIVANDSTMTISVRDFPENLAAIEAAIKLFDKPDPPRAGPARVDSVDVQISLIAASNDEGLKETAIPAALSPVFEQLRRTLNFKRYRFMTTLTQRMRAGLSSGQGASGSIADPFTTGIAGDRPAQYDYKLVQPYISTYESGPSKATVQLEFNIVLSSLTNAAQVNVGIATPTFDSQRIGISTGLAFREGEQVVVGTTSAGTGDKSIIIVLTMTRAGT